MWAEVQETAAEPPKRWLDGSSLKSIKSNQIDVVPPDVVRACGENGRAAQIQVHGVDNPADPGATGVAIVVSNAWNVTSVTRHGSGRAMFVRVRRRWCLRTCRRT